MCAIARPIIIPIEPTIKKSPIVFSNENCPEITATKATLKTIKLEASLIKLSPSKIVTNLLGIFKPFKTEVAATASGGEIIPPNKNPKANVNPGMMELVR